MLRGVVAGGDAECGDRPAGPVRRGAPGQAQRDQRERDWKGQCRHPDADVDRDDRAGGPLADDQRQAADREHHRDRRADEPANDVGGRGDRSLGQELARRQRQQLALARGDGGAEQADPERQVERKRRGPGNAAARHQAHRNLGKRQQHDAAEREGGKGVLGPDRESLHRLAALVVIVGVSLTTKSNHDV
jgi:hypothetical protein